MSRCPGTAGPIGRISGRTGILLSELGRAGDVGDAAELRDHALRNRRRTPSAGTDQGATTGLRPYHRHLRHRSPSAIAAARRILSPGSAATNRAARHLVRRHRPGLVAGLVALAAARCAATTTGCWATARTSTAGSPRPACGWPARSRSSATSPTSASPAGSSASRSRSARSVWWSAGSPPASGCTGPAPGATGWSRQVLVVGDTPHVLELVHTLRREPYAGYQVVGACIPDALLAPVPQRLGDVPVVGSFRGGRRRPPVATGVDTVAVTASGELTATRLRRLGWQLEGTGDRPGAGAGADRRGRPADPHHGRSPGCR